MSCKIWFKNPSLNAITRVITTCSPPHHNKIPRIEELYSRLVMIIRLFLEYGFLSCKISSISVKSPHINSIIRGCDCKLALPYNKYLSIHKLEIRLVLFVVDHSIDLYFSVNGLQILIINTKHYTSVSICANCLWFIYDCNFILRKLQASRGSLSALCCAYCHDSIDWLACWWKSCRIDIGVCLDLLVYDKNIPIWELTTRRVFLFWGGCVDFNLGLERDCVDDQQKKCN